MTLACNDPQSLKLLKLLEEEFGVPKGSNQVTVYMKVGEALKIEVGYFPQGVEIRNEVKVVCGTTNPEDIVRIAKQVSDARR